MYKFVNGIDCKRMLLKIQTRIVYFDLNGGAYYNIRSNLNDLLLCGSHEIYFPFQIKKRINVYLFDIAFTEREREEFRMNRNRNKVKKKKNAYFKHQSNPI